MIDKYISRIKEVLLVIVVTCFIFCGLYACASLGSPGGGAYDLTPPRFVSSTPTPDAIGFNGNKIEIVFDELILLENASEKVIITPPQRQLPVIRSLGNKARIELKDSLWPNTTYTIDFTDAIVDNNEKNALEGFTFAFSTGETLDSLVIAGRLLNAENLEPMPNILIGLHTNLDDSAFVTEPFRRTTRTNDKGEFWMRNVSPGTYRIFALNDMNRDYKFDQPGEAIAFYDSLIIPTFKPDIHIDTIWTDTTRLEIDTILEIPYTHFLPDDVLLFFFQEEFARQYMLRPERNNANKFTIPFNTPVSSFPEITLLDREELDEWFIPEITADRKSISYWITDSLVSQRDTLKLEVNYLRTDSMNLLSPATDTLKLTQRKQQTKTPAGKKKEEEEKKIDFLGINISGSGSMDVFDTLRITFSEPVLNLDGKLIKIEEKVDTLWEARDFPILADSLNPLSFWVNKKRTYGQEYQISIDSAAITSIYGKWNDKQQKQIKFRAEKDYGHIYIMIEGADGLPGIGELLDNSEKVVRRAILRNGGLAFMNLMPGKYYLRYIADWNGNRRWDTGNFSKQRQPEPVFYYHDVFDVRQDWMIEHTWNLHELPVEQQKPLDLIKNKPQQKNTNKEKYEEYNQKFNKSK